MPDDAVIATKLFTVNDQSAFARLSGDWNPMHMDPVAARRTPAGAPVTHGIHLVLWAIENLLADSSNPVALTSLKARFAKWVYVGETATLRLLQRTESEVKARIEVDSLPAATFSFGITDASRLSLDPGSTEWLLAPATRKPLELTMDQIQQGDRGVVGFQATRAEIAEAFPVASSHIGAEAVAAILASSTLVGMVCPGLHSMYSTLSLKFHSRPEGNDARDGLSFEVKSSDDILRKVKLEITSASFSGTIDAFVRTPPVSQQSIHEISEKIVPGEFAQSCSLVVGGSRGLGALTAKILAAGGGDVVLTYTVGKTDAEAVADDIRASGRKCTIIQYDALQPAEGQLAGVMDTITHLYYFATPAIFRSQGSFFAESRFSSFADFYIKGFYDLCMTLKARNPGGIRAFYPSSVAVEDRPAGMLEYSMAKAAGEVMCAEMNQFAEGIQVVVNRLPRLATDQTATVVPVRDLSSLDVLLPIVRTTHER
jgi:hypothetical protein